MDVKTTDELHCSTHCAYFVPFRNDNCFQCKYERIIDGNEPGRTKPVFTDLQSDTKGPLRTTFCRKKWQNKDHADGIVRRRKY